MAEHSREGEIRVQERAVGREAHHADGRVVKERAEDLLRLGRLRGGLRQRNAGPLLGQARLGKSFLGREPLSAVGHPQSHEEADARAEGRGGRAEFHQPAAFSGRRAKQGEEQRAELRVARPQASG